MPDAATDPFADDAALVERCLKGDRSAWVALVSRYRRLIYSVPVRLGLPPEQADEVFQDVCVRLLRRLDTLRDGRSLVRWLTVTARRRSLDLAQYEKRFSAEEDAPVAATPVEDDPEAQLLAAERAHHVRRAFEAVSERCRELLHDLFYRDPPLSYAEIAERSGRPHGSLGPTRLRCLKSLRGELGKQGFE